MRENVSEQQSLRGITGRVSRVHTEYGPSQRRPVRFAQIQ